MILNVNETYHGFLLKKYEEIQDCAGEMYTFEHLKTGAQLIWMKRDDQNKTFAITFKTTPTDDTGVFHILEHSVLSGSEKYPLREPFVELLKSSLQTFLNAFTAPDKTMYPVSSRNDKDFMNLVSVYMDAVFHPEIYRNPSIFYQEGWHYEIRKPEDMPVYKGVVLNEMKGAFSSADEIVVNEIQRMMFPDNCYQYCAGGYPPSITDLSYEKFIETHETYYHPSNSRTYLDGDLDIDALLKFINDEYFSKYEKEEMDFSIPMQELVPAETREVFYDVADEESMHDMTIFSLAKIIGSFEEIDKIIAWGALTGILVGNNESPLKKAVLDSGLAQDVELDVLEGIQQPWAILTIRNTEKEHVEELKKVIRKTVEDLVKNGLDHDELAATLNQMEFRHREKGEPAGLIFAERCITSWLYDGDPALYIRTGTLFAELRERIKDNYFEKLLEEFLLDDEHLLGVIASPSLEEGERQLREESEKLTKAYESWGEKVNEYIAINAALDQWQSTPDSPEVINSLPKLALSDVEKTPSDYPFEVREINGTRVHLFPKTDTGIVYLHLYFNIAGITKELLPQLGAWITMLINLPTKKHSVQQLQAILKRDIGHITFDAEACVSEGDDQACTPLLIVSVAVLEENVNKVTELLHEIMFETIYDAKMILTMLKQENEEIRSGLIRSGHSFAIKRVSAQYSADAAFQEYLAGYEAASYMASLEEHFEEEKDDFIGNCEMFADILFSKSRVTASVTGEENLSLVEEVLSGLHTVEAVPSKVHYPMLEKCNEAIVIPAGISFGGCAASIHPYGYKYDARMMVVKHILTFDWLWSEVRVKGGAYGTGFHHTTNGRVGTYSYRNPDPINAINAAKGCGAYLKRASESDLDIEQMIIGTIASVEPLMSLNAKIRLSDLRYFSDITYEKRCKTRQKILSTKKEDLAYFGEMIDQAIADASYCIVGPKDKIKECKDLDLKILKKIKV